MSDRLCPTCGAVILTDADGEVREPVAPHQAAYDAGMYDGKRGVRIGSSLYPPGIYGHADYELGYEAGTISES